MKPSLLSFEVATEERDATFFLRVLIEEHGMGDTYFELLGEVYHKYDTEQGSKSHGVLYEFRYGIHPTGGMTSQAWVKTSGYLEHLLQFLETPRWGEVGDVLVSVRHARDPKDVYRKGSASDPRLLQALAVFQRDLHYRKIAPLHAAQHLKNWIGAVIRRRNADLYRAHKAIAEMVG